MNEEGEIEYLTAAEQQTVEESVHSIVHSIIATSINEEFGEVNTEVKTSIVFQEYNGETEFPTNTNIGVPMLVYMAGAALGLKFLYWS